MPVMGRIRANKIARVHSRKSRVALKKAMKKLVVARVLRKNGKTAKAAQVRKAGQKALTRAVTHLTRAAHAKAKVRIKANKRGGSGSGGILSTIGSIAGGILSFL